MTVTMGLEEERRRRRRSGAHSPPIDFLPLLFRYQVSMTLLSILFPVSLEKSSATCCLLSPVSSLPVSSDCAGKTFCVAVKFPLFSYSRALVFGTLLNGAVSRARSSTRSFTRRITSTSVTVTQKSTPLESRSENG
jgi:hypothetical protein